MVEIRTWYTYATEVLGYLNPKYKLAIGITRESTSEKLEEVPYFLICPKHTKRHKKDIFKSIYHSLYDQIDSIVLPKGHFLVQSYGKIIDSFVIKLEDESDYNFLRALGPFTLWTLKHLEDYTKGKNIMQEGVKVGNIAIFIMRVYNLEENILIDRPPQQSVSNQYFNWEIEDEFILDFESPIVPEEEFNEIISSIKYIYSLYIAMKSLKNGNSKIQLTFEDVWQKIQSKIEPDMIIYTLKQKKANKISELNDSGILVKTERGTELVKVELIRKAWENLVKDGILYRDEHEKSTYRSSFILTLLSQFDFIDASSKGRLSITLRKN